jgi:hypothetical protein
VTPPLLPFSEKYMVVWSGIRRNPLQKPTGITWFKLGPIGGRRWYCFAVSAWSVGFSVLYGVRLRGTP